MQAVLPGQADSRNSPNSTPVTPAPRTPPSSSSPPPDPSLHPTPTPARLLREAAALPPASGAPQARGTRGSGPGRLGVQSPLPAASWAHLPGSLALLFQNCLLFSAAIAPARGKAWSVGHGGAPRQAPGTPQSEGQPRPLARRRSPAPSSWGRHLGCGHSPRPAPLPLVGCAGRWADGPMRIRDPAGR